MVCDRTYASWLEKKELTKKILYMLFPIAVLTIIVRNYYDLPSPPDPALFLSGMDLVIYSVSQTIFLGAFIALCVVTGMFFTYKQVINDEILQKEKEKRSY